MAEGPYLIDPGSGGYTLEPQGMPLQNFFNQVWGPVQPFNPQHGFGPGPVPDVSIYRDAMPIPQDAMAPILGPRACPQPCPTTVDVNLCMPRKRPGSPWDEPDEFGDPAYSPPGVRVVPEWEPAGVKSVPGGPALVGPGGSFVFPTPKLPAEPRGTAVPAGEVVGPPGAVTGGPKGAPAKTVGAKKKFSIPWWGWLAMGVVAWQVLGRR